MKTFILQKRTEILKSINKTIPGVIGAAIMALAATSAHAEASWTETIGFLDIVGAILFIVALL